MSKILNRPMFRGGGKVSSYGNGITSPLVPGYEGGGQIGGGAIYGELMPDGRYGFQAPKLYNAADQVAQAQLANVSPGMEYLESLKNIKEGNIPMIPINIPREKPIQNDIIDTTKEIDISGGYMEEDPPEGNLMTEYENWEDVPISIKNIPFSKDIFENQKKKKENSVVGRDLDYQDNLMQENYDTAQEAAKKISTLNFNDNNDNTEESTVLSTKDAITENQELFKELLGSKKARGQDIADMLLRFSGSEGDTVGEKFKNYTKIESTAKSRTRDLKDKATGFAIQESSQNKLLDKKLQAQSDIADKNLIATVAKLDRDGQYKKKVDDIIRDRFNGDQSKRAEASRIALGDEATIEAAVFDKTAGGMPLSPGSFDLLAAGYTDGPIPGGDLAGISGTFFIPGKMQIITIVEGVVDQNTLKDFSPKA